MAAAIALRSDFTGADLRRLARRTQDAKQARRLLSLATIYDGGSRSDAARIGDVGLQIIRDWVLRFNAAGPDGLVDRKAPGPEASAERRPPRGVGGRHRERSDPLPSTVSCAGVWSISASGCGKSSGSAFASRR